MIINKLDRLLNLAAAAAEVEGPEGTAPKTVDPLEFVVFNTDEFVLQEIQYFKYIMNEIENASLSTQAQGFLSVYNITKQRDEMVVLCYLVDGYWHVPVPENNNNGET